MSRVNKLDSLLSILSMVEIVIQFLYCANKTPNQTVYSHRPTSEMQANEIISDGSRSVSLRQRLRQFES
ncbi:hypothetical protein BLOT_010846 [Blomia tropicalis]|nr:hypothetical protein BLOT_010846 [Blomia tropicalis]